MKKSKLLIAPLLVVPFLASCGGGSEEYKVSIPDTNGVIVTPNKATKGKEYVGTIKMAQDVDPDHILPDALDKVTSGNKELAATKDYTYTLKEDKLSADFKIPAANIVGDVSIQLTLKDKPTPTTQHTLTFIGHDCELYLDSGYKTPFKDGKYDEGPFKGYIKPSDGFDFPTEANVKLTSSGKDYDTYEYDDQTGVISFTVDADIDIEATSEETIDYTVTKEEFNKLVNFDGINCAQMLITREGGWIEFYTSMFQEYPRSLFEEFGTNMYKCTEGSLIENGNDLIFPKSSQIIKDNGDGTFTGYSTGYESQYKLMAYPDGNYHTPKTSFQSIVPPEILDFDEAIITPDENNNFYRFSGDTMIMEMLSCTATVDLYFENKVLTHCYAVYSGGDVELAQLSPLENNISITYEQYSPKFPVFTIESSDFDDAVNLTDVVCAQRHNLNYTVGEFEEEINDLYASESVACEDKTYYTGLEKQYRGKYLIEKTASTNQGYYQEVNNPVEPSAWVKYGPSDPMYEEHPYFDAQDLVPSQYYDEMKFEDFTYDPDTFTYKKEAETDTDHFAYEFGFADGKMLFFSYITQPKSEGSATASTYGFTYANGSIPVPEVPELN